MIHFSGRPTSRHTVLLVFLVHKNKFCISSTQKKKKKKNLICGNPETLLETLSLKKKKRGYLC